MTEHTYDREITALLVIDPYNDFISEGGKIWDRLKGVAEANGARNGLFAALLAEQGDQFQSTPGVDDLAQGSVDRRPQGSGAENLSGLLQDVWINFDRCLGHTSMISGRRLGRGGR